jgi:glycerol-3-phosphate dehydrogenase
MRPQLRTLDGERYDVVIIGAGVNGASAAQHLSAAGYSVLLIDKGDFASGSSSRSSRLLHCGLRYLAPGASMWDFVRHPGGLATALRMAKQAMESRAQFVTTAPERARPMKFHFPIYRGGPYANWQVGLAFRILTALGPKSVPLDYRRLSPSEIRSTPLVRWLREPERLLGVAGFCEYQFEWPERICVDAVLDAERMGAVVRNYTYALKIDRDEQAAWRVVVADTFAPEETAVVHAKMLLNMAGIWIDRVNGIAGARAHRCVTGTKGVHVMFRLPPECEGNGIATINRVKEPFYCVPWRGLHYFGPTETLYEGNIDDIRPLEEEVEWIIDEANYLLPELRLKRADMLFAWAGVRPLTYDSSMPKGKRSRQVHKFSAEGLDNLMAMTAGPVMTHRSAGAELTSDVRARIPPSRPAQILSYAARLYPRDLESPPLLDHYPETKMSDLRVAAQQEHAESLTDLMFRRVGAGWTATMGAEAAERAAAAVADVMNWDVARVRDEVRQYREYLAENHLLNQESFARKR